MEPFLGSIMVAGFSIAPKGWTFCNGGTLPISSFQALFSLFGTMYGGDGRVTFGLPDLRGRVSLGFSAAYVQGQQGGEPSHTLTIPEMPRHNHFWKATSGGPTTNLPTGNVLAGTPMYNPAGPSQTMISSQITTNGGSQAHENRSPYLVLNFCVALSGIFPPHS